MFATLGFFAFEQGIAVSELNDITGVLLSFVTFPAIVSEMPGGPLFGALFFGSLVVAGFTSLLSVLQVVSAAFQEKFNLSPRRSAATIGVVSGVLSVLLFSTTTGLIALDTIDHWVNNIGIVTSAILTVVFVLWMLRKGSELRFHLNSVSTFQVGRSWLFFVGLLAPVVLGYMLIQRIVVLVSEGYEGYPLSYLLAVGWGAVLLLVIGAVVMPLLKWKRPVDDFDAWPEYAKEVSR